MPAIAMGEAPCKNVRRRLLQSSPEQVPDPIHACLKHRLISNFGACGCPQSLSNCPMTFVGNVTTGLIQMCVAFHDLLPSTLAAIITVV